MDQKHINMIIFGLFAALVVWHFYHHSKHDELDATKADKKAATPAPTPTV